VVKKKTKKVVAVLACRVGSTRLFGKPLQKIGKYTILELLISQIKKSKIISDIVLAISENPGNEVFIDFAKKHRLKFIIGNEKDMLMRLIKGANLVNADIVFRVTTENPYLYWEGIDNSIKQHIKENYDFSMIEPIPSGSGFQIINRKALEISHVKGSSRHHSEHCDLYINEHKNKFKTHIFQPEKILQRSDIRLTVDTPQDLILVREIFDSLIKSKKPIQLEKIIKFLDKNPELLKINSSIHYMKKSP
jgi:spore coat polysaccharide biosynthesis protein SpsF|tara:strand:- start:253 stop:999 length:747 start_codon:yes stop_codon:yes gene_type:complete